MPCHQRSDNIDVTDAALPSLAERIDAALPQTQCTRCGYPDCAAYAQAIAEGSAPINQCPPGGSEGVARLAAITGQAAASLNPQNGIEAPRSVAIIDEAWCIGCTLCLPVCPTDAIFGSNKAMHVVIEPHCTGCALCLPVCPVDCISLEVVTDQRTGWAAWSASQAGDARQRYEMHRLRSVRGEPTGSGQAHQLPVLNNPSNPDDADQRKRSVIEAALARARAMSQKP